MFPQAHVLSGGKKTVAPIIIDPKKECDQRRRVLNSQVQFHLWFSVYFWLVFQFQDMYYYLKMQCVGFGFINLRCDKNHYVRGQKLVSVEIFYLITLHLLSDFDPTVYSQLIDLISEMHAQFDAFWELAAQLFAISNKTRQCYRTFLLKNIEILKSFLFVPPPSTLCTPPPLLQSTWPCIVNLI